MCPAEGTEFLGCLCSFLVFFVSLFFALFLCVFFRLYDFFYGFPVIFRLLVSVGEGKSVGFQVPSAVLPEENAERLIEAAAGRKAVASIHF